MTIFLVLSSVHGDSPGKNTGVDCHFFLQGIFPTQGLNPGLPHCRWILLPAEPQGKMGEDRAEQKTVILDWKGRDVTYSNPK